MYKGCGFMVYIKYKNIVYFPKSYLLNNDLVSFIDRREA